MKYSARNLCLLALLALSAPFFTSCDEPTEKVEWSDLSADIIELEQASGCDALDMLDEGENFGMVMMGEPDLRKAMKKFPRLTECWPELDDFNWKYMYLVVIGQHRSSCSTPTGTATLRRDKENDMNQFNVTIKVDGDCEEKKEFWGLYKVEKAKGRFYEINLKTTK